MQLKDTNNIKFDPLLNNIFVNKYKNRLNKSLENQISVILNKGPKKFSSAINYVLSNKGKQLRPLLLYAVGCAYGAKNKYLDAPAVALEMIHSFSLVHDDLPSMDNDKLRRGKLTCHLAFDESTAILVGDVLSIEAFNIINNDSFLSFKKKSLMTAILARYAGIQGMISGEYIDLHQKNNQTKSTLIKMYLLKTSALFRAAVKLGAIAAEINDYEIKLLDKLASIIGLIFQIRDDINDINEDKRTSIDNYSRTYPLLVSLNKTKYTLDNLEKGINVILKKLNPKNDNLYNFIYYILSGNYDKLSIK